jgi:TonB-linked SusC/RagA family outer membrane protein
MNNLRINEKYLHWRRRMALISGILMCFAAISMAQNITVKGTVTDNTGEPLAGVSIIVQGTTTGVATDADGDYTINVPNANSVLQFSYLGYITATVKVEKQTRINVILEEDTQTLDEVVVVGYGTQKKSDVTGSLTQVTEKTIKERPVQNALQAMQGKAAGVDININTRPGELGDVRIRGNRSITAGNDPLYVVDGIPLTAGSIADINPNDIGSMEILKDASATAIYGSRGANGVILITTKKGVGGRTTINYDGTVTFSQIHSLTDWMNSGELIDWNRQKNINAGSYTGSYGNAPDPSVDANAYFGGADTYPYMRRVLETAFQFNADGTPVMRDATDYERNTLGYADRVPVYNSANIPTTPWTDYVTRTAATHNHQVSLSSGTDKSRLYMSVAYLDQQSTMVDQDYKRYTANVSGEIKPRKWLTVGLGMNGSHSIRNYGIVSNFSNTVAKDSYGLATNLMPYAPAYNEDGTILAPGEDQGPSADNVLLNINTATNETRYYGLMFNSFAEIQIMPWLKWRTNFGYQFRNSREGSFYADGYTNPFDYESTAPRVAYNSQSTAQSWTLENLIYADKTFADIHTVGLTLLQSAESRRNESISSRAYDVVFPTAMWYDLGNSNKDKLSVSSGYSATALASYMARLNYSLLNRYLLTATGRWDGASVLAPGNKWAFYPSAAVAWKLEEEEFMKSFDWLDQLKLRAGYGVTGNAAVSAYKSGGSMGSTYAKIAFGQGAITSVTTGAKALVLPNVALGWENTASTNFGVDFGIFNNRISGSIEYFNTKTSDLLLDRGLPIQTGYTTILTNIGKTRNRGFEVTLSTVNIKTRDFTWRTDFSFTTNKEEIVELANGKEDMSGNGWFIGQPVSAIWQWKYDRLWQNTEEDKLLLEMYKKIGSLTFLPGQAKLVDQPLERVAEGTEGSKTVTLDSGEKITYLDNGFGKFDDDDRYFLGSTRPDWLGGFTTTFNYKNWQLNSFIYARIGAMYYGLMQTYGRRVETDVWSESNPEGKYPQPRSGGTAFTDYSSYMNWARGNIVAVRNIALSYTLPEKLLGKLDMSSCQIYAQVLNPFIFGGELVKTGINPDDVTGWSDKSGSGVSTIGGQTNNTIMTRSFVIGLRLGF